MWHGGKNIQKIIFSIVVVGGVNGTAMTSVEILDEGSDHWTAGPELPFGIYRFIRDYKTGFKTRFLPFGLTCEIAHLFCWESITALWLVSSLVTLLIIQTR